MSASYREQVMTAIVATLAAGTPPAGLTVHRERTRPIETDSLPAIMAPLTERQLGVVLECRAQASLNVAPDVALDPITVWATQRMFADVSFGGLANEVEEGRSVWQSREGDVPVAACAIHFTVKYRTSRLDPTTKG